MRLTPSLKGLTSVACVILAVNSAACGSDSASNDPAGWRVEGDRSPDQTAPDAGVQDQSGADMAVVEQPDAAFDMPPAPAGPQVRVFRYRRQFEDCAANGCVTELQIGVLGGMISRVQSGGLAPTVAMTPEDRAAVEALLHEPRFIDFMRQGWRCPEAVEGSYRVSIRAEIAEAGQRAQHIHEISGCYASPEDEPADALVELSERLFMRYFR